MKCCYIINHLKTCSAFQLLSVPWTIADSENGVDINGINKAIGDGRLNHLLDNPLLCKRLKIEAIYESALEDQTEEAEHIRREEGLIIPDDINYFEYIGPFLKTVTLYSLLFVNLITRFLLGKLCTCLRKKGQPFIKLDRQR